ncbi:MAG: anthranilate phosphoribosyltransferase [Candidatus Acidiferrales bacterium]
MKLKSAQVRELTKAHNRSMIHEALEKVVRGEDLTWQETTAVMGEFYSGQVTPSQMAALWTALSMKGMTNDERAAVDKSRREHAPTTEASEAGHSEGYEFGHPKFCAALVVASLTVVRGEDLSRKDAEAAMEDNLSGNADDVRIAAFLAALRFKGETVDEVVGFAKAMRRHAVAIFPPGSKRPDEVIVDTCGTGGDGCGTFNVSTAAAFVVAGAGVRVAKHGNRSTSSRCGSADVLEALGVKVELGPERVAQAIETIGIGFLYAPAMHSATRHATPARRELRMRTVFNLLGPLTNPAGASAQVVGVYDGSLTELVARALGELGVLRAFVVHGADGLDEISISGETSVAELRDGAVRSFTVVPEDFGLRRAPLEAIRGGDAQHNAGIIHKVLGRSLIYREHGPHREIVLANAAAALVAAGRATDFLDGVRVARESIDSGAARAKLDALAAFSQAEAGHGQSAP